MKYSMVAVQEAFLAEAGAVQFAAGFAVEVHFSFLKRATAPTI